MRGKSFLAVFLVCLAVVCAIGQSSAQSSSPVASAAAPQLKQVAYLKASNAEAGDHFGTGGTLNGHAVAISADGNTMAIGAPNESSGAKGINGNQNDNSVYSAGAVYVFARRANTWAQQAYIKASNPGEGDMFGFILALSADGNTLAVSAYFEASAATGINGNQNDDTIPQAGAVYVFTRRGVQWSQQAYIKASNTGEAGVGDAIGDGDQFGFSLALSQDGNTLAVGAIAEDSAASGINVNDFQRDNSQVSSGAVYLFTRSGATWTQQAYIKAANSQAGDLFGYAVALSANGNILAASGFDEGGSPRVPNGIPDNRRGGSGVVYVFERTGAAWRQRDYVKGSRSEGADSMGVSVALSADGNVLAAGVLDEDCTATGVNPPGCDNDREADLSSGAVYVWVRNGNNWTEQAFLKASNTGQDDWFGSRLAISGDGNSLAVGAQVEDSAAKGINGKQDDDSAEEAGALYLFTRSGNTWTQQAYVKGSNTEAYDEFGSAMALSGDGKTLVVSARGEDSAAKGVSGNQADNSADEAGAAYVFTNN